MNKIKTYCLLFIATCYFNLHSQSSSDSALEIAEEMIKILESTEAINNLILNKEDINGKLQDINIWSEEDKISPKTYNQLKDSYTLYSAHMNNIFENLSSELRSIKRFRQIKKLRLDKIINEYSGVYAIDLQAANRIYTNGFLPSFEIAKEEAEAKGILSTLILIIKFGETLYNTLAELFDNGKISRATESKILSLASIIVIKELKKKMYYEPWEQLVYEESNGGNSVVIASNKERENTINENLISTPKINTAPYYREVDGFISLANYKSDIEIPLNQISKRVIVGTENEDEKVSLPMFATTNALKNGDRFWVKINGYEFVRFFYYDEDVKYWQDPFGKKIIVRNEAETIEGKTLYLPAKDSFFKIAGDTPYEEFLILVSNSPIPENKRNVILGSESRGTLFIEKLSKVLPNVKPPSQENGESTTIKLTQSGKEQIYIPIYIKINK
ncbi:hypothetical protein [Patiriisocius hiemis]|uniref:DUF4384 domain-containing protein n=1 Tax=Patiriisocius hiemis TaxID=3075604 RepID=A0ABU2YBZ9_9FLAO|nr:hypothetical protein [Constantimarinum sp. W242]MDT0555713.1 hypothetical protein [Constantimarinum sp. W242]